MTIIKALNEGVKWYEKGEKEVLASASEEKKIN